METLVRDLKGFVHRRFDDASLNFEEGEPDEETVEESDLVDISAEAWCKYCFEMTPVDEVME